MSITTLLYHLSNCKTISSWDCPVAATIGSVLHCMTMSFQHRLTCSVISWKPFCLRDLLDISNSVDLVLTLFINATVVCCRLMDWLIHLFIVMMDWLNYMVVSMVELRLESSSVIRSATSVCPDLAMQLIMQSINEQISQALQPDQSCMNLCCCFVLLLMTMSFQHAMVSTMLCFFFLWIHLLTRCVDMGWLCFPMAAIRQSYWAISRGRTIIRSVSCRNWYWVYRMESYRLLLYRGKPTLRASLQIPQLISENRLH